MTPLQTARDILRNSRKLVVFTGAGVSADSGIPTFRGAGDTGFWGKFDPMKMASPEGFLEDPKLVYDWYNWRRSQLPQVKPNPAHDAIARLQQGGAVIVTQNVDDLHERVAPAGAVILKLHGTIIEDKCFRCDHREKVDAANLPPLRHCPVCGEYMRPAVVWFGEGLDPDIWNAAEDYSKACDTMLVVGTSGQVYPAAGLVFAASNHQANIIVVNLEESPLDDMADVALHGRAADIVPRILGEPSTPSTFP